MGHRTLKRVPLDFDWPLKETWGGYQNEIWAALPKCPDCDGGWSIYAEALRRSFYPSPGFVCEEVAWCDKLTQKEVDLLFIENEFRVYNKESKRWESIPECPTAAEVNKANGSNRNKAGSYDNPLCHTHGGGSMYRLVRFRCEQIGAPVECETCQGHMVIASPEERQAAEDWVPTEPPTGDGWQLWETTSEGSPVTPVFASAEELADWCADNATVFAHMKQSAEDWLRSFLADSVEVESMLILRREESS